MTEPVVPASRFTAAPAIYGVRMLAVRARVWLDVARIATRHAGGDWLRALRLVRALRALRRRRRGKVSTQRYAHVQGRYFWDLNCPGWPGPAFDNFVRGELSRLEPGRATGLQLAFVAVTRSCPLRCAHCSEWDTLNQPDPLSLSEIKTIVARLQEQGVSQILLTGGEPMQRADLVQAIVRGASPGTDFWVLTSGTGVTAERARSLRSAGLVGAAVSVDHVEPAAHDAFRGSPGAFDRARAAVRQAREADLLVCLSLVPQRDTLDAVFIDRYFDLARAWGASFVQILDPRATGRYAGKDIALSSAQVALLDRAHERFNWDPAYASYPASSWQGYQPRRRGCEGAGNRFAFVDTAGDVHACPFCPGAVGSALHAPLGDLLSRLRAQGCGFHAPATTAPPDAVLRGPRIVLRRRGGPPAPTRMTSE